MGNSGINHLARVLQERIRTIGDSPPSFDFGIIQNDMSLLTNSFPLPIPEQSYITCRCVSYDTEPLVTSSGGYDAHTHTMELPKKMYRIKPGDRVLVAWAGNDAVIIDVIK